MGLDKSPVPISGALRETLSQVGLGHLADEGLLRSKWGEILGPRAASLAHLETLKGFVLRIRVENASWRMELNFEREGIRRRANTVLGRDAVREVVLC
jgi:predicted nucleic acid-binding Zn ribbon protein